MTIHRELLASPSPPSLFASWRKSLVSRSLALLLFFVMFLSGTTHYVQGDETRQTMNRTYELYKDLQPFLVSQEVFQKPENASEVSRLIRALHQAFHGAESMDSKYHQEPGFDDTLKLLADVLADAQRRFDERKSAYDFWRLRKMSQACTTCHAVYNVNLRFDDQALQKLSVAQQLDFYLASRQTENAAQLLQTLIADKKGPVTPIELIRKIILLFARVEKTPAKAAAQIRLYRPGLLFNRDEKAQVELWLVSLDRWASQQSKGPLSLRAIRDLVETSGGEEVVESRTDSVGLLRATTELHEMLHKASLSGPERGEALYLLGYSYRRLSDYFLEQFPEFYLKQCMQEFPGTTFAKLSYKLYRRILVEEFSGSGGTHLPPETKQELRQLREKAYGGRR